MSITKPILHVTLIARVNEMTEVSATVPHWQVPAYEAKFGEDLAIAPNSEKLIERAVESVDVEIMYMVNAIGINGETKQPWWEAAYGGGIGGKQALKAAILSNPETVELSRDINAFDDDLSLEAARGEVDEAHKAREAAEIQRDQALADSAEMAARLEAMQAQLNALTAAQSAAKEPSGDGSKAGDPLEGAGTKDAGKTKQPKA